MKVSVQKTDPIKAKVDVLVAPIFKEKNKGIIIPAAVNRALKGLPQKLIKEKPKVADEGSQNILYTTGGIGAKAVLLAGAGEKEKVSANTIRKIAGSAARTVKAKQYSSLALILPKLDSKDLTADAIGQAAAEGLLLGDYSFDEYKTPSKENPKTTVKEALILPDGLPVESVQKGAKKGALIAQNVILARDLVNRPANVVNPAYMVDVARNLAKKHRFSLTVWDQTKLKQEKMNTLLAVAQGSVNKPYLVMLEYKGNPKSKDLYAVVGKGVCFDSGGLNIKPTGYMENMKDDMSGAAASYALIALAAELKLPMNLLVVAPLVENSVDGGSYRPSDIIKSASGKTIEIGNTDAEGRLILADALFVASKRKPKLIVDIATLTGACVVALGEVIVGVMTNRDALAKELVDAGLETRELAWQLPMFSEFDEAVKGDITDIKNTGWSKGEAGTITAAVFLRHFIGNTPWVHLDIAGPAYVSRGNAYTPKGGTGAPVRLMLRFLEKLIEKPEILAKEKKKEESKKGE
ncbi:cytosol aminopeptidase [uncultured archaeon]|nr:cytosol aminopeptidase [uncultured archaeon]